MADEVEAGLDAGDDGAHSEANAAEAPALTEVEQLAAEMGWKPEAEYSGDKSKWKPARDFIMTEREINRGLKDDVRHLKDTINRLASTQTKQTERALRAEAEKFQRQFNEAVENKDTQAAAAAADGLRELQQSARADSGASEVSFASRNSWYGTNDEATAYAIGISQREAAKGKSHAEQLEVVEQMVRKRFPELFDGGQQRQESKAPAAVHSPGRAVVAKREKGFADMPAAARAAAESYAQLFKEKHGLDPEKSKADYARDYWADQAA